MEIRRAALGEDHPQYAGSLRNLAPPSVAMDRGGDALALMQKAAAIDNRMIGQIFSIGSEQQRAGFLASLRWNTDIFLSLVLIHLDHSHEAVLAALDLVLRRKALRAEGQAAQRDAVLGDGILTSSPGSASPRRCGPRSSRRPSPGRDRRAPGLTTGNWRSGSASRTTSRKAWPARSPR